MTVKIAKIYKPCHVATQSGCANNFWVLEFISKSKKYNEPLMGWVGSKDTDRQLKLKFASQQDAELYAKKMNIAYVIQKPKAYKPKPKSYTENFLH